MTIELQIVFIVASLLTFYFVIRKVRKHKLNIDDSIIWILWALILLVLSLFPNLAIIVANKLGFMSTSNFIFSLFTFFLYIILFFQTISISALKEKNKQLIQKLSIKEFEDKEKDKK